MALFVFDGESAPEEVKKKVAQKAESDWSLYMSLYDYNSAVVNTLPHSISTSVYLPPLTLKQCIDLKKFGWNGPSKYFYSTNTHSATGYEVMKVPDEFNYDIDKNAKVSITYKLKKGEWFIPSNKLIYLKYLYEYNAKSSQENF